MTMSLTALVYYVRRSTVVYRKGEVIKEQDGAVTIDDFPAQPDTRQVVDCHFVTVGFTEYAPTWTHRQFYDTIAANPVGQWATIPAERFEGGPSYIEIGGWIGDQTLALQFMALGELHGLWQVMTPAVIGATGQMADELAGRGMIMINGFKEPDEVPA
jgi:hypothetical protein